jgi:hypothetical protein
VRWSDESRSNDASFDGFHSRRFLALKLSPNLVRFSIRASDYGRFRWLRRELGCVALFCRRDSFFFATKVAPN